MEFVGRVGAVVISRFNFHWRMYSSRVLVITMEVCYVFGVDERDACFSVVCTKHRFDLMNCGLCGSISPLL